MKGAHPGDVADRPEPLADAQPVVGSTASASGSSPTVSSPMSPRLVLRPVATSSSSASNGVAGDPDPERPVAVVDPRRPRRPARTSMPSSRRTPRAHGAGLGLLPGRRSRVGASRRVTRGARTGEDLGEPHRSGRRRGRRADSGTAVACMTSRLVQYGVPSRPSIGGLRGSVPVLRSTPREPSRSTGSVRRVSTRTRPGRQADRARGRSARRPPRAERRAGASVQSWLASRIRAATGDQSGVHARRDRQASTRAPPRARRPRGP